jgi:hypothetical protein
LAFPEIVAISIIALAGKFSQPEIHISILLGLCKILEDNLPVKLSIIYPINQAIWKPI